MEYGGPFRVALKHGEMRLQEVTWQLLDALIFFFVDFAFLAKKESC